MSILIFVRFCIFSDPSVFLTYHIISRTILELVSSQCANIWMWPIILAAQQHYVRKYIYFSTWTIPPIISNVFWPVRSLHHLAKDWSHVLHWHLDSLQLARMMMIVIMLTMAVAMMTVMMKLWCSLGASTFFPTLWQVKPPLRFRILLLLIVMIEMPKKSEIIMMIMMVIMMMIMMMMIIMMMHSRASLQRAGGIHRVGSLGRRGTLCQPCPRSLGTAARQWHQTVRQDW